MLKIKVAVVLMNVKKYLRTSRQLSTATLLVDSTFK
jgi:hypothetical protein